MRVLALLPVLAVACNGGTTTNYSGYTMSDYFPLDGERSWEYSQEDEEILWQLSVEKVTPTETVGNDEVVTLEYSQKDPVELLYSIKWSSSASTGIEIFGYSVEATGESVSYDTPIGVADFQMRSGETVDTEVDGVAWQGTFVGIEDCPNLWVDSWECVKMTILDDEDGNGDYEDDDDDDAGAPPFEGSWWLAPRYGASRFLPNGYDSDWVLSRADWSSEDSE